MVRIPASRARRHNSATGSVSAVFDVWWLRKSARVRGVTPAQTVSTISSAVVTGSRIGVRTYRAPKSPADVLPGEVERAVLEVGRQHLVAGLQAEWPGRDVDSGRRVRNEDEIVRVRAHIGSKLGPGLCQQSIQAAGEKQHRLALELELPLLVALEHRSRCRAERAVVQKSHA